MMAHTPGPWEARPSGYSITGRAGGPFYWNVYAGNTKTADYLLEDDARLIAAAPEMLEALKAARDWIEEALIEDHLPVGEHSPTLKAIDAVIAKAEGQP